MGGREGCRSGACGLPADQPDPGIPQIGGLIAAEGREPPVGIAQEGPAGPWPRMCDHQHAGMPARHLVEQLGRVETAYPGAVDEQEGIRQAFSKPRGDPPPPDDPARDCTLQDRQFGLLDRGASRQPAEWSEEPGSRGPVGEVDAVRHERGVAYLIRPLPRPAAADAR